LKLAISRVWLAYRLVKHPRALAHKINPKKYGQLGLVATELEKLWELPKKLEDATVSQ